MAKAKIVGSFYWATGPLVIGSEAVRKLVQKAREPKARKILQRVRGSIATVEVNRERVLVLTKQLPATWVQLGKRAGVVVRVAGPTGQENAALAMDPWAVPEKAWKPSLRVVQLAGPSKRVLFDSVARLDTPITGGDASTIGLSLPAGKYRVDRASQGERDFKVTLYRIRPEDVVPSAPKRHKMRKQPGPPADLTLRKETVALARKLKWVSTDGGPMLAAPRALLRGWHGTFDANGNHVYDKAPCDYDRACEVKGLVLDGEMLVLEQFSTAFLPRPDGTALVLFWVGADDGSHVLEAVLSAPAKAWKPTKETFTMTGTELAFLDAAQDGKEKPASVGKLAAGKYRIDRMTEYDGQIVAGKQTHGVMATAIRLRPA